jgi:hypothetical protein
MFLGHYAMALAAKRASPSSSLGTLVFAAQFLDLLWPLLLLLNLEHVRIAPGITRFTPLDFYHYPISHSLVAVLIWAGLVAAGSFLLRHNLRSSLLLAGLVVSHWILDAVVHRPDLPVVPGEDIFVGLGLWNSVPLTLILETILFGAGVLVYSTTTEPRDGRGGVGFWAFVLVLYAVYLASVFGPPPPDVRSIAWAGMGQWLFVLWAWWIDQRRMVSSHLRS